MPRKKSTLTVPVTTETEEENRPMASNNANTILSDDDDELLFQYDESLENVSAPEPLPESEYTATITDVRKGVSQLSGKEQILLILNIDPEEYPVDYNPENAPDGVRLLFYSRDVDSSRVGMYNMKVLAQSMKVPLTNVIKMTDFRDKKVKVNIVHKTLDDGTVRMNVKGNPTAL